MQHESIMRKKQSSYHLNRDVVVSKRNGDLKEMSIDKGGMGDMGQGCRGAKDTLRQTDSQREIRGATTALQLQATLSRDLPHLATFFLRDNDTIIIELLWRTDENLIKQLSSQHLAQSKYPINGLCSCLRKWSLHSKSN